MAIAIPNFDNPFTKALLEVGLLPVNCKRYVIDSGPADGVMTMYFDCYLDQRILEKPVIRSLAHLAKRAKKKR